MPTASRAPGARACLMIVYRPQWSENRAHDILRSRGFTVDIRCPARGDPLPPSVAAYAGVIVGGGLDDVLEASRLPYVDGLVQMARSCLDQDVPYLGFCFGAQVLAAAADGEVLVRPDGGGAFGYRPVVPAGPEGEGVLAGLEQAYHLNFHGFTTPPGATPLARGELFPSDAFRVRRAFAFQFHPEVRADQIEAVLNDLDPETLARPGADPVSRHLADAERYDGQVALWLKRFMDDWLAGADRRTGARAHATVPGGAPGDRI